MSISGRLSSIQPIFAGRLLPSHEHSVTATYPPGFKNRCQYCKPLSYPMTKTDPSAQIKSYDSSGKGRASIEARTVRMRPPNPFSPIRLRRPSVISGSKSTASMSASYSSASTIVWLPSPQPMSAIRIFRLKSGIRLAASLVSCSPPGPCRSTLLKKSAISEKSKSSITAFSFLSFKSFFSIVFLFVNHTRWRNRFCICQIPPAGLSLMKFARRKTVGAPVLRILPKYSAARKCRETAYGRNSEIPPA